MEILKRKQFASYLKPRARDWHKGLSGHVLIVGGNVGMSGAPRLAALSALRVGAGLVSIATHVINAGMMNAAIPEIMCHGVKDERALLSLLEKVDVVVLGPGLGQCDWAKSLWMRACEFAGPLVVDADGLNLLAKVPVAKSNWILTPHPGEAARLLQTKTATIQADREQAITHLCDQYAGVCVLKGAGTLIKTKSSAIAKCKQGNPGMATAGMGDVLAGIIGGLLGQKIPSLAAAQLGVLLHAHAGDMAAKVGERGMIATDIIPYLRELVNPS